MRRRLRDDAEPEFCHCLHLGRFGACLADWPSVYQADSPVTIWCASVVSNGGVPAGILSARRRLTSRERAESSIYPRKLFCSGFGIGLNCGWVPFRDLGTVDAWR